MLSIEKEGHRYSFFQVVRLLQQAFPDRPRLGGTGPASRELLRLRPSLDLAFAPSDVREVRRVKAPDGSERYEVTVAVMGLYCFHSAATCPMVLNITPSWLRM